MKSVALFFSWSSFFSPFNFLNRIKTVFEWWLPREIQCLLSLVLLCILFLFLWVFQTIPFLGFGFFFLFQIGDALIEIASNIMLVDDHVLWMAQKEDKACTRIVRCVEHIASQMLTSNIQVISKVFHKITKLFVRIYFKNVTFLHNFYNQLVYREARLCKLDTQHSWFT